MSSSELLSPIMIRTGSPVSCRMKKTTVTTQKMTMIDCHNRRRMYCATGRCRSQVGGKQWFVTAYRLPPTRSAVPVHLVGPYHLVFAGLPLHPVVDAVDIGQGVHEEGRAVFVEHLLGLLVRVEALLLVKLDAR